MSLTEQRTFWGKEIIFLQIWGKIIGLKFEHGFYNDYVNILDLFFSLNKFEILFFSFGLESRNSYSQF